MDQHEPISETEGEWKKPDTKDCILYDAIIQLNFIAKEKPIKA